METIARCSEGHLFITPWTFTGSLRAVWLGRRTRFQHCPVGDHWTIVRPVEEDQLTEEERRVAASA